MTMIFGKRSAFAYKWTFISVHVKTVALISVSEFKVDGSNRRARPRKEKLIFWIGEIQDENGFRKVIEKTNVFPLWFMVYDETINAKINSPSAYFCVFFLGSRLA